MKYIIFILITGIILGVKTAGNAPHLFQNQPVTVIVTPTPTPIPTDSEVIAEVVRVFGEENRHEIIHILNCFYSESGLRWNALHTNTNGSVDSGVAQINNKAQRVTWEEMQDYKKNIAKAYQIWLKRGKSTNAWYGAACDGKLAKN